MQEIQKIRNIAIIAHVDHGKTTLLDAILDQTGCFASHKQREICVMDSNPLEKERGITILAKNTSVKYQDHVINIVDTPGHADFGGEVERVLSMVQGCLLLVDAFEGPMPQTRFVLRKAFEQGLKPILVINKVDKPNVDINKVIDNVLELFIDLGANDEQIEFPIIYASGVNGVASLDFDAALKTTLEVSAGAKDKKSIAAILDTVITGVPAPTGDIAGKFLFQAISLDASEYLGRMLVGRILEGKVKVNQQVNLINAETGNIVNKKIARIYGFNGLEKIETEEASAGMIVILAGLQEGNIGDTVSDTSCTEKLPAIKVDEPTLEMVFSVNDSPIAGQEGKFVTSRQIRERLFKELETNVALRVEDSGRPDAFQVAGRGELHLGILLENMRREGYELQVSKPQVIIKTIDGTKCEPFEDLVIDVDDEHSGTCIEALNKRRGDMTYMHSVHGRTIIKYIIPTRGLIGFTTDFVRMTKGTGIINHSYLDYRAHAGEISRLRPGVLVNLEEGVVTGYALEQFSDRGIFFVSPGTRVYKGMIVGECTRAQDVELNLTKEKQLTNMRAAGSDATVALKVPRKIPLEEALVYIGDDELVEITPENIRLRKKILDKKTHRKEMVGA